MNGSEDELYLASADWMTRNFDKRIELLFPVERPEHKAKALHALRAMFRDNVPSTTFQPALISGFLKFRQASVVLPSNSSFQPAAFSASVRVFKAGSAARAD